MVIAYLIHFAMTASTPSLNQPTNTSTAKRPSRFWVEYYGVVTMFMLAVFVGIAMFVLRPAIMAFRETNQLVASKIQDIQKRTDYQQALDRSIAAAQSIDAKTLERISQTLPSTPGIPLLLLQIGTSATKNQLHVTAISFAQTKPSATKGATMASAQPIDVSLTVSGKTYADVKRFLADIESSSRLLDVTGISASGRPGEYNYAIQLRTYVYPDVISSSTRP